MADMKVWLDQPIGAIRKVNGVGQPPLLGAANSDLFHYLKEANIPYSRLHDVGGTFGGGRFVDIPNVFPNFDADENDPASYFFPYTDWLIKELVAVDAEPVYRLGVTIENAVGMYASQRIFPPKDFHKWARVCEHIIRHYTEGWANGFFFKIDYWEIWNEPDNHFKLDENAMWQGTKEQYYALYEVTANHLKERFPHIKIGGPASCGFYAITSEAPNSREEYFVTFAKEFLAWISSPEHKAPLDFFSWHSYAGIEVTMKHAAYARALLDQYGFTQTEHQLNEWNPSPRVFGLMKHAAYVGGMLCAFQNSSVDTAMFYDARIGISEYGSMFNPITHEPYADYDAFVMFGRLLELGVQVKLDLDVPGVYAVAAAKDGKGGIMLVNTTEGFVELNIQGLEGMKAVCEETSRHRRMEKRDCIRDGKLGLGAETMIYISVQ